MGSLRYPTLAEKKRVWLGMDVDLNQGGNQIEYEDQNPGVHKMFLEALAKSGAQSKMGHLIDESEYKLDPRLGLAIAG